MVAQAPAEAMAVTEELDPPPATVALAATPVMAATADVVAPDLES